MGEPYAHPEVLGLGRLGRSHSRIPKVRIVESDEDILLYDMAHIPGAVRIDWQGDLQDQLVRDYINAEKFAAICSKVGIANDTTVVFYGDKSNWWACYAFWAFKLFGHARLPGLERRPQALARPEASHDDRGPELSADPVHGPGSEEERIRIFRDAVLAHAKAGLPMIDVRSPKEFTGEKLHMEDYPQEGALRGGHIPAPRTCPGAAPSTRTARSSRPPSSRRSTKTRSASSRTTTSSPTAASASAPA